MLHLGENVLNSIPVWVVAGIIDVLHIQLIELVLDNFAAVNTKLIKEDAYRSLTALLPQTFKEL